MSLKSYLVKKYIQLKSWKSSERIVVIESDDWGTERTRDKEALKYLLTIHPCIENDRFTRLDSIASVEDLTFLFEVLTCVKDVRGNYPKFTANVCTANPDFDKIKTSGFRQFYYEPFYETIKRKTNGDLILKTWKFGIDEKIFIPQLHGREHVHAMAWLDELGCGNPFLLKAFEHNSWGIPYKGGINQRRRNVMAALDVYGYSGEVEFQQEWILDSASIFQKYFGFAAKTFIPPAYTWHNRVLPVLKKAGIEAVQGISLQYEPKKENNRNYQTRLHINGAKNKNGILRLARNVSFEPASSPDKNWVDRCLAGVEIAFSNNMPAIIGSHRINYIGSLDSNNRDTNLRNLKQLLKALIKKYPDIIFLSSDELLDKMGK